jgi:hypothetical protein
MEWGRHCIAWGYAPWLLGESKTGGERSLDAGSLGHRENHLGSRVEVDRSEGERFGCLRLEKQRMLCELGPG